IKGSLKVQVGDHTEVLHEGDSIYYKSSTPHGMIAVNGEDCLFLAMVMAEDEEVADTHMSTVNVPNPTKRVPLICDKFIKTVEDENGVCLNCDHTNLTEGQVCDNCNKAMPCSICNDEGHTSANCPTVPVCSVCGTRGHSANADGVTCVNRPSTGNSNSTDNSSSSSDSTNSSSDSSSSGT
ncbi:MAG: cupin domain-containing protein, partial [Oscillospiraceae bacterium]|nr:cupin domain-containing protein [Oscillospiraceae bacterium]